MITLGILAQGVAPLSALTLSNYSVSENAAQNTVIGAIQGKSSGSTLSIFSQERKGWFAISGTDLVVGSSSPDFETDTSATVTIRETLAGSPNSPRDTTVAINITNVFEQPSLNALSLSSSQAQLTVNSTHNISGATAGSTLSVSGGSLPPGMTLNSGLRRISGTPTQGGNYAFTLRETLADSPNSPRDTFGFQINVAAAPVTLGNLSWNSVPSTTIAGQQYSSSITGGQAGSSYSATHSYGPNLLVTTSGSTLNVTVYGGGSTGAQFTISVTENASNGASRTTNRTHTYSY